MQQTKLMLRVSSYIFSIRQYLLVSIIYFYARVDSFYLAYLATFVFSSCSSVVHAIYDDRLPRQVDLSDVQFIFPMMSGWLWLYSHANGFGCKDGARATPSRMHKSCKLNYCHGVKGHIMVQAQCLSLWQMYAMIHTELRNR